MVEKRKGNEEHENCKGFEEHGEQKACEESEEDRRYSVDGSPFDIVCGMRFKRLLTSAVILMKRRRY